MPQSRPTVADVDVSAFLANYETARRLAGPGVAVMAVLKANGYGHGAVALAKAAVGRGCPMIGVATVAEGIELREAGLAADVLVLGGFPAGAEEEGLAHSLSAVVFDLASAGRLDSAARRRGTAAPVHVKVDTGMGRLGFLPHEVGGAAGKIAGMSGLRVEGAMTHYARADEADPEPTLRQASLFDASLRQMRGAGLVPRWIHARNSAALLRGHGPAYNLARPGIMLYGSLPSDELSGAKTQHGLCPVLTLRTAIHQLKEVPGGWPVSYGGRYVAEGSKLIGVLPVGYADGFMRYNAGGEVLVRGQRAAVAGTVCMDMTMIDVTGIDGVRAGDEAVLIGRQGDESVSASEIARRGGTISYEVFCGLSSRVPRRYLTG